MKILLSILSLSVSVAALAAEPVTYYKVEQPVADSIAAAATATVADADQRLVRENAVKEAFAEFFKTSQVKPREIEKINDAFARRDLLADSLSRVQSSIARAKADLEAGADSVSADPLMVQAQNDIAHLQARIDKAREALEASRALLAESNDRLAARRRSSDSIAALEASLRSESDRTLMDADVRKSLEGEVVIEAVREAMKIPGNRLAQWDIPAYQQAAARYGAVAMTADAPKSLTDSVAAFNDHILPAALTIDHAVTAMAGKYDAGEMATMADYMKKLQAKAAKNPALKPYRKEIDEVATATADQDRASRNFRFLMSSLGEKLRNSSEAFDVPAFTGGIVALFTKGEPRYPEYYKAFNTALDRMAVEVYSGYPGMSDAEIDKLIDQINASVFK